VHAGLGRGKRRGLSRGPKKADGRHLQLRQTRLIMGGGGRERNLFAKERKLKGTAGGVGGKRCDLSELAKNHLQRGAQKATLEKEKPTYKSRSESAGPATMHILRTRIPFPPEKSGSRPIQRIRTPIRETLYRHERWGKKGPSFYGGWEKCGVVCGESDCGRLFGSILCAVLCSEHDFLSWCWRCVGGE